MFLFQDESGSRSAWGLRWVTSRQAGDGVETPQVPLHLPARGELQSQAVLYKVPERKGEKSERLGFVVCRL